MDTLGQSLSIYVSPTNIVSPIHVYESVVTIIRRPTFDYFISVTIRMRRFLVAPIITVVSSIEIKTLPPNCELYTIQTYLHNYTVIIVLFTYNSYSCLFTTKVNL